jgi:RNA polymerase sigma factor (sigma-70 family)
VRTIRDNVIRASDIAAALSDRHEAFGDLVIRFQDMAFAYAFAVLRDAYLAEDVAQEAFITAWHKLPQLREPEAFPGWFKRIVATQCNRLLRTKRLQFVAPELARDTGTHEVGLDHSTERRQLVQKVLRAVSELPDKQRVVTMLFYVDGYTQNDIGRFLDVPISTVNKRLYTARETLKERMVEVVKDDLEQHRPSRNRDFSNEVNAKLRPLSKNDWSSITRLAFGSTRDALGKELWLSRRRNFAESRYIRRQYVAEERRRIVGYGAIEQSVYLPRYNLFVVASPAKLREGVGDLLMDQLFEDLENAKAITVSVRERGSKPPARFEVDPWGGWHTWVGCNSENFEGEWNQHFDFEERTGDRSTLYRKTLRTERVTGRRRSWSEFQASCLQRARGSHVARDAVRFARWILHRET